MQKCFSLYESYFMDLLIFNIIVILLGLLVLRNNVIILHIQLKDRPINLINA